MLSSRDPSLTSRCHELGGVVSNGKRNGDLKTIIQPRRILSVRSDLPVAADRSGLLLKSAMMLWGDCKVQLFNIRT